MNEFYREKMGEAFELMNEPLPGQTPEASEIIKALHIFQEISDRAKGGEIYIRATEKIEEYKTHMKQEPDLEKRIVNCWMDFLNKVDQASGSIQLQGLVILIIPTLSELIEDFINVNE